MIYTPHRPWMLYRRRLDLLLFFVVFGGMLSYLHGAVWLIYVAMFTMFISLFFVLMDISTFNEVQFNDDCLIINRGIKARTQTSITYSSIRKINYFELLGGGYWNGIRIEYITKRKTRVTYLRNTFFSEEELQAIRKEFEKRIPSEKNHLNKK